MGKKEIPTNILNGKTPIRGVVIRKKKVIFDEVFYVNTEDLYKTELSSSGTPFLPKESFYKIMEDNSLSKKHNPKKDYQFWGNCMWEYSIFNIEDNKWGRFRMLLS